MLACLVFQFSIGTGAIRCHEARLLDDLRVSCQAAHGIVSLTDVGTLCRKESSTYGKLLPNQRTSPNKM